MAYSMDLSGRVAFVTGASGEPGAQFARTLARAGAGVVLASRRVEKLKELRAHIEGEGGDAHVIALDVSDHGAIKAAVAHAETEVGSIDILVNNTGGSVPVAQRLQDLTPAEYDIVFAARVKGAFFVAQEVGKRMLARSCGAAPGSFTGGRIINVASVAGLKALAHIGAYGMSQAAVLQMTRAMALEWGRFGINVNALCIGRMASAAKPGQGQSRKPVGKRTCKPEDLDALLVMLASDQSHFVNGAVIVADNGFSI